jgi:hypothetical protein
VAGSYNHIAALPLSHSYWSAPVDERQQVCAACPPRRRPAVRRTGRKRHGSSVRALRAPDGPGHPHPPPATVITITIVRTKTRYKKCVNALGLVAGRRGGQAERHSDDGRMHHPSAHSAFRGVEVAPEHNNKVLPRARHPPQRLLRLSAGGRRPLGDLSLGGGGSHKDSQNEGIQSERGHSGWRRVLHKKKKKK